jgi:hypothetical protein
MSIYEELFGISQKSRVLSPEVHGMLLAQFFTTQFDYDERVYIFPGLSDQRHKELTQQCQDLGLASGIDLHGRDIAYPNPLRGQKNQPWVLVNKFLDPFVRKAGSEDARLIRKLNDFVDWGFNIFFAINPLSFNSRSKRTVLRAQNLLLESDSDPLDFQERVFMEFRDNISAMVYSGNHSIHALVKVSPALFNPHCLGWKDKETLQHYKDIHMPSPSWYEYDVVANYWIQQMASKNLTLDKEVALDWSRVSRVPGFAHSKSGKPAQIIFLNPDATPPDSKSIIRDAYWNSDMVPVIYGDEIINVLPNDSDTPVSVDTPSDSFTEHTDGENQVYPLMNNNSYNPEINEVSIDGNSMLGRLIKASEEKKGKRGKLGKQSLMDTRNTRVGIGMRNVTPILEPTTFLDDLETYETLKMNGISARHLRRTYHGAMLTVRRVFLWDDAKFGEECRKILSIHPSNIDGDIETNVADLLKDGSIRGVIPVYLPNTAALPEIGKDNKKHFIRILFEKGCKEPRIAFRIIDKVLWDFIRVQPLKCQAGKLGIHSASIMKACKPKPYRAILNWLEDKAILVCTNTSYEVGGHPRTFFVNIPLIIYLLGFKSSDLNWSEAIKQQRRKIKPEVSHDHQEQEPIQAVG